MAFEFYVTIDSAQGRIKGECDRQGHEGKIPGRWFRSRVAIPREDAPGKGTKRKHEPLTFRKRVGPSTPRLLAALCSGEMLTSVLFEFVGRGSDGQEAVLFSIKLSDAVICGHNIIIPEVETGSGLPEEEVELTARRITWEAKGPQAMVKATDDWTK